MLRNIGMGMLIVALIALLVIKQGEAATTALPKHNTDGGFNLHTGNPQTDESPEWSGPNVARAAFGVVGSAGGSVLYAEQGAGALFLMYDWTNSPQVFPGGQAADSFFDVFFQVAPDDYVVRILGNQIVDIVEKATASGASSLNPDGSFNLGDPLWTHLTLGDPDVTLAAFDGVVGFGPSPNSPADHLMAEFELTLQLPGQPHSGFYSPQPAFWSASAGAVGQGLTLALASDPPISAGIFILNSDGTTTIIPSLDSNGAPAQQPQDASAVPEPSTLVLFCVGLVGLALYAERVRKTNRLARNS